MSCILRKQLWDNFYSKVIVDILIDSKIKSPTLKESFKDLHQIALYTSVLEDLKKFFESASLDYLLEYTAIVFEETYSKEEAEKVIDSILTSV